MVANTKKSQAVGSNTKTAKTDKQCCVHPTSVHNELGCGAFLDTRSDNGERDLCRCMNKFYRDLKIGPADLKTRALEAFNESVQAFRKNQSATNWSNLELAMLALQQSNSRFKASDDLAERALVERAKHWLGRKSAKELIDEEDWDDHNSMNAAALRED